MTDLPLKMTAGSLAKAPPVIKRVSTMKLSTPCWQRSGTIEKSVLLKTAM